MAICNLQFSIPVIISNLIFYHPISKVTRTDYCSQRFPLISYLSASGSERYTVSTTVYILKLEAGRFYVGKTEKNVETRYQEHVSGDGSAWTRMYKPLKLFKTFPNADPFDEDKRTKEYMALFGIDNVRGGTYVQMDLNEDQRAAIQREIWMAEDRCTNCGIKGHYAKDCNAQAVVTARKRGRDKAGETLCFRCGRRGHVIADCYAACHLNGYHFGSVMQEIPLQRIVKSKIDEAVCYRCGRAGHMVADCYAKSVLKGYAQNTISKSKSKAVEVKSQAASVQRKVKTKELEVVCYRCGRPGHVRPECYAARHVKGYDLDDD